MRLEDVQLILPISCVNACYANRFVQRAFKKVRLKYSVQRTKMSAIAKPYYVRSHGESSYGVDGARFACEGRGVVAEWSRAMPN